MNEIELKTKIEGLKKAIEEHKDFAGNYESDLAKCEQELKDYNKPELTLMQMDDVYEAIEKAVKVMILAIQIILKQIMVLTMMVK